VNPPRVAAGIVGAGALALVCWVVTRPSDETRIRRQLDALAKVVHVTEADVLVNPLGRLAHVNDALSTLVDHDVRVTVPELPMLGAGRQEMGQAITGAPRYVSELDVDFKNVSIKFDEPHMTALVGATADIHAKEHGGPTGRVRDDARAVDLRFAKADDTWIITTITVWAKDDAPPR
jgi:hypothetical protein